jgi:tRNA-specific adenosine deaminase 3
MKNLSSELPLGRLQHLKRVRPQQQQQQQQQQGGVEVLLCLKEIVQEQQQQHVNGSNDQAAGAFIQPQQQQQQQEQQHALDPQVLALLPASTAAALAAVSAQLLVQRVPLYQPDTKQQWQEWIKVWPMPWRVPSGADEQDGAPATADEQAYFEQHMAAAFAASAAAGGKNVAVIVDPSSNCVLAQAVDCSERHPLDHAAMVAVEAVAARDRQLWPFNGFAHLGRHAEQPDAAGYVAVAPPHHARSDSLNGDDASRPPKKQKAAAGSNSSNSKSQHQQDDGQLSQQQQHQQQQPDSQQIQPPAAGVASGPGQQSAAGTGSSSTDGAGAVFDWASKPYLCTGYDCFVVAEPCTMCAMGLVHSRLARIIYCKQSSSYGALGGRYKLHAQRTLNHHYKVYHLPLQQQQQQQGTAKQQQPQQQGL